MKQEITIPEGCNATIDHDNRLIVIESIKEQKFKRGDILAIDGNEVHVFGGRPTEGTMWDKKHFDRIVVLQFGNAKVYYNTTAFGYFENHRYATEAEKQILFDALAKEGKYWDAESLEVKDFIKVPENIGVYRTHEPPFENINTGDKLAIAFNNNKQALAFMNGEYIVDILNDKFYSKVQCYLKPCKREELIEGDTCFASNSQTHFDSLDMYNKLLSNEGMAFICDYNSVGVIDYDYDYYKYYYKLIPIK